MEDKVASSERKLTELLLPSCPMRHVVVYPDRAEVTREVSLSLDAGEHEVQLKNICKVLDKDTVRVNGIGAASITEVSFQEIPVTEQQDDQSQLKEEVTILKDELSTIKEKLASLSKEKQRIESQKNLFQRYSSNLLSLSKKMNPKKLTEESTVDNMFGFLETYEKESLNIIRQTNENEKVKTELEKRSKEINEKLSNLTPKIRIEGEVIKQTIIGILLAVKEKGDIKLLVSYVVSNAGWSPRYDLRVDSSQRTMTVGYFGMIKQNTGEDWSNTKVSLSTATPSIGGNPPKLSTLVINLIQMEQSKRSSKIATDEHVLTGLNFGGLYERGGGSITRSDSTSMVNSALPQATVNEGLISSVFEITALASMPSNNEAHKVSIATIELKPIFEYETVPRLSQHAFLRAKVKNNSRYSLLAGPANVFLDQAFVTKSCLGNVLPQEEFTCSLGVDPSVKVFYKPLNRYREEAGFINVSVIFNYKQVIEITNLRSEPATVHFADQIPLSKEDKLKVVLLEPVIAKVKAGQPAPNPNLTAQNHVKWTMDLAPGETKTINIRYYVEYPKNKQIEGL